MGVIGILYVSLDSSTVQLLVIKLMTVLEEYTAGDSVVLCVFVGRRTHCK
jgi:hypothetical protein